MRTVDEVYLLAGSDLRTRRWLDAVSMYNSLALLDPKTGKSLKRPLSDVMIALASLQTERIVLGNDRIARLTAHCRAAIRRLIKNGVNAKFRQVLTSVPVREAHEFNQEAFMRIAIRPGRTLREKLAGKSEVDAVQNISVVNLPENRLLKACIKKLVKTIVTKLNQFPHAVSEDDQKLLQEMRVWLRGDIANQIGEWRSPPPNNALLSHRDYRLVWDSWRDLCTLAENLEQDLDSGKAKDRWNRFKEWDKRLRQHVQTPLPDCPVDFDDEEGVPYELLPEGEPRIVDVRRGNGMAPIATNEEGLVCLDLRRDCPVYACQIGTYTMDEAFVWQRWEYNKEFVSMPFWRATKYYAGVPDVQTVTLRDLFKDEADEELLKSAALCFCEKLAERFSKATVGWLLPDSVDDFDVRLLRRYLNFAFSGAEPIPTSVALLFEQKLPDKIHEGYTVAVVDRKMRTYLIAHTDKMTVLQKRVPESLGVYWERTSTAPAQVHLELKYDVTKPPVAGGLRLMEMQQAAGDEPLWCDCLPQLVMNVFGRDLILVKRAKAIRPLYGVPVDLEIETMKGRALDLIAGSVEYSFPLIVGDGKKKTAYKAVLCDASFPLSENISCTLRLTYTLGADDPYELLFIPLSGSSAPFKKLKVKWERMTKADVENLPVLTPPFVAVPFSSKTKNYLSNFFKWPKTQDDCDRLIFGNVSPKDYAIKAERFHAEVFSLTPEKKYCIARLPDGQKVFCPSYNFMRTRAYPTNEDAFGSLSFGSEIWVSVAPSRGKLPEAKYICVDSEDSYPRFQMSKFVSFRDAVMSEAMGDLTTSMQQQFAIRMFEQIRNAKGNFIAYNRLSRALWVSWQMALIVPYDVVQLASKMAVSMLRLQMQKIQEGAVKNIKVVQRDIGTDLRFILGLLLCRKSENTSVRELFSRSSFFFHNSFELLKQIRDVCKEYNVTPFVTGLRILRGGRIVQGLDFLELVIHYLAGEKEEASIEIRTIEES